MKHRFLHVDIAKGLGIFFVVLGHNWWVLVHKGEAYRILYSFHVPLFFLLSGLFLRRDRPFRAFFFSKMDALCKPYVVVLSCLAIFSLVEDPIHLWQTLLGILYGNGDTIDWTPLWFLPHLCVVSFSSFLGG